MTAYAIAQIRIHDRARYQTYVDRFMPVLRRFGGRLLAADEAVETLEGDWPFDKLIVIAFESEAALTAWAQSDDYRTIARDRLAATEGVVLLAHGLGRSGADERD